MARWSRYARIGPAVPTSGPDGHACARIGPCGARTSDDGRPAPGAHRVAVLALDGVIPFELASPPASSARATRSRTAAPLYEVRPARVDAGRRCGPTPTSPITVEHGPEALATADTVVVPGRPRGRAGLHRGAADRAAGARLFAAIRPGTRLVSICTGALSCWPPPACSTAARRPRTGRSADHFQRLFPRVQGRPRRAVRRRRRRADLGRGGRRDRPVPAPGAPRPRHGGRQRGGPPHRRAAAPGGRPGAVHPPAGARAARSATHRARPAPGRWTGSTSR